MAITHAFSFMVHPKKGDPDAKTINGSSVPLEGKMFGLLSDVYGKAEKECDIDITFNPSSTGKQDNACRNIIRTFAKNPTVETGRDIAFRLRNATDGRSGPGLLFLILGKEGDAHKLLISRFPADSGILAEEKSGGLKLDFLEKIFLKSAQSYKPALYRHVSLDAGFWTARAVDRQTSSSTVLASEYWIRTFLDSDFQTTSAAGTLRLANALKAAVKKTTDPGVTAELISMGALLKNMGGQTISIDSLHSKYSLSDEAYGALRSSLKNEKTASESFKFSYGEFADHVPYRSIVLDSGVTITAPFDGFEGSVEEVSRTADGIATFSVRGRVVDQKLQKAF
ncbi:MAG: hypothetical protein V4701_09380 [Pseudomonadota bacterium]